jgi:hypothetical protein
MAAPVAPGSILLSAEPFTVPLAFLISMSVSPVDPGWMA